MSQDASSDMESDVPTDDAAPPQNRSRRFGIRARLFIAFAAVACFTLISGGVAWYSYRNVKINGHRLSPPEWDDHQTVLVHHFTVGLDSQQMPTSCIAPNGDVLLEICSFVPKTKAVPGALRKRCPKNSAR